MPQTNPIYDNEGYLHKSASSPYSQFSGYDAFEAGFARNLFFEAGKKFFKGVSKNELVEVIIDFTLTIRDIKLKESLKTNSTTKFDIIQAFETAKMNYYNYLEQILLDLKKAEQVHSDIEILISSLKLQIENWNRWNVEEFCESYGDIYYNNNEYGDVEQILSLYADYQQQNSSLHIEEFLHILKIDEVDINTGYINPDPTSPYKWVGKTKKNVYSIIEPVDPIHILQPVIIPPASSNSHREFGL